MDLELLERWVDDAAYEHHASQEYVATFGAFMATVMTGPRVFTSYDVVPRRS